MIALSLFYGWIYRISPALFTALAFLLLLVIAIVLALVVYSVILFNGVMYG